MYHEKRFGKSSLKIFVLRKHMFVHSLLYNFNLEYKDIWELGGVVFSYYR